jgi:hypothetical protein
VRRLVIWSALAGVCLASVGLVATAGADRVDQGSTLGPTATKARHFVKACGAIAPLGATLNVDIAEGRLPTTCRQARHVMRYYITKIGGGTTDVDGCCSKKIRLGAKVWRCYKSRQDGVGWAYHCNRLKKRTKRLPIAKTFVDVGAGRRF